jgi:hypothetical protein
MQQNNIPMLHTNPAAVAAAETAKAETLAAYQMALHMPRDTEQARQDILKLCKKPDFAAAVEYRKPIAGGSITGLSIRFVEQALRLWRNVRTTQRVVYEDDDVRRIMVKVIDLESNAEFSREISVTKTVERKNERGREIISERTNSAGQTVFIVKATDDEMANKEGAAVAKALRNEGGRLLPYDLKEEALHTARQTLRNQDAKDPDAAKRKVLDAFADIGISAREIESLLKHKIDSVVPAELEELRTIYQAIKGGEARWSDYIIVDAEPSGADKLNDLTDSEKSKTETK